MHMKRFLYSALGAGLVAWGLLGCAATQKSGETVGTDLMSDTWVATDALGRQMPLIDSVGPVKTDHERVVGIFYITWHSQNKFTGRGLTPMSRRSFRKTLPPASRTTIRSGNTASITGVNPKWAISSARTSG